MKYPRLLCMLGLMALYASAQAKTLAVAQFDLAAGRLCFPMQLTSTGKYYDACLKLEKSTPPYQFSLLSSTLATHDLASIGTYGTNGLKLPLVRVSDGRVFADANFSVAVNTATSAFTFTLTSARRIDQAYDFAHQSVARLWNEAMLNSIRSDLARPTVHARNLFHTSVAMYDAWSAFTGSAEPYLLGNTVDGYSCAFISFPGFNNVEANRKAAISYAAYRVLRHRFAKSPGAAAAKIIHDDLMLMLGYDPAFDSRDYSNGSGAALGNHIGDCVIAYGLQDGANEANNYAPLTYKPVNTPLTVTKGGNTTMTNPDRWQSLAFETFIDQSGNVFQAATPPAVTPEWGRVLPFALAANDASVYQRDGANWMVYLDPGPPALLKNPATAAEYRWSHEMVAIWSSHHNTSDGVMWDISPGGIGNIPDYPTTLTGHHDFYDWLGGGDTSRGRTTNPVTGKPYAPQIVPRGDYTRVLAQYWADGPRSETPPGHWYTIFNRVADHPLVVKRYRGQGPLLSDLEWDVKGYFLIGGTVHDVAVTAWGIKGWYDSSRPVSAIRYMAERGQSSDPHKPNYHAEGLDIIPGYIEQIVAGDPLAGANGVNIGKMKLYAWRGTPYITDTKTQVAGAGWILATEWVPYQTRTFVTPPFPGYISGHSTFSRAAATVMTLFTGSEYFPGGMSEFVAKKNEYLDVERGPSVDVILQWATYQDASDQTSLSRIWGGIHPPMDDIVGRYIGSVVGDDAFTLADKYFRGVGP